MDSYREERARAAGFFNGEGCIRHEVSNTGHSIRITISQSGIVEDGIPEDLTQFKQAVRCGTIRGPYQYSGFGKPLKPKWTYVVGRFTDVISVMGYLRPWLSVVKTLQYDRAMAEYEEYIRARTN